MKLLEVGGKTVIPCYRANAIAPTDSSILTEMIDGKEYGFVVDYSEMSLDEAKIRFAKYLQEEA